MCVHDVCWGKRKRGACVVCTCVCFGLAMKGESRGSNTLQHTAALQHTAKHNTLQHTCNTILSGEIVGREGRGKENSMTINWEGGKQNTSRR